MKSKSRTPILLSDYTPPPYLIDEVALDVVLTPQRTKIRNVLTLKPNPARVSDDEKLVLNGEHLELTGISLDGRNLSQDDYELTQEALTIFRPPQAEFTLTIDTICDPDANKALSGLYRSNDTYCTQCEAEGFRRITYYPDRPDVLARFTTRIEAPKSACPILLSNGNPIEQGDVDGTDKHYAVWRDPHPKPCYLFALVAGDLGCISDQFTTMTGRTVELKIYVEPGKEDRAGYAMDALKRSMKWDEEKFGREYDLDIFMIVAVSDFNMGAMENKGLNIFNDKYILARPDTASDEDYANIEAVVAHEYFHNWTGNRITCRDWFQLCLKEGLTVFRDQEFTADMRSRTVQRIDAVRHLLNAQFPEDAGPLAHPVRPNSYFEINNFYTTTVYEKGSELIRMIKTLLGADIFRQAMDLYFERHDGDAATVEDFLKVMEDSSGKDLEQFKNWYTQAGTPELTVAGTYNAKAKTYELSVTQFCPPTPEQTLKSPFPIPLDMGLIGKSGNALTPRSGGHATIRDGLIEITEREQTVLFTDVDERPTPSLLRDFSAPVKLTSPLKEKDLLFLMANDTDPFNRWRSGQTYALQLLRRNTRKLARQQPMRRGTRLADALRQIMLETDLEPAFRARCLELPSLTELARDIGKNVNPDLIHTAREGLRMSLGELLETDLVELLDRTTDAGPYSPDAESAGGRALRNTQLGLLAATGKQEHISRVKAQFDTADNMTDTIGALRILTHHRSPAREMAFERFYQSWQNEPLVLDKWFMLQAISTRPGTLENVIALKQDRAFTMDNPNRVRSLIGAFATHNLLHFHQAEGAGYGFVADAILELDANNPQVAARLAGAFKNWRVVETARRGLMKSALERIAAAPALSRDTAEIVSKSLG